MKQIRKIRLQNFKRFQNFSTEFDSELNIIIGDNESGKSSILLALDLILSGSKSKVETVGLEYLFNTTVIENFLNSEKKYQHLPELRVEVYLNEQHNEETNGKNNEDDIESDGLKLTCRPNDEFGAEIKAILQSPHCVFPFEFYTIEFRTFADQIYSGYNKPIKHILIDNAQISSEYAMKEYVSDMYHSLLSNKSEKHKNQHEYRLHKENFKTDALKDFNDRLKDEEYHFALKSNSKTSLEVNLTIYEGKVSIDNKGKGKQCLIKTALALSRNDIDLDIVLIEEPENHLSHLSMKKMIDKIRKSENKQIFITTHNDLISTRLDLRKSILLNSSSERAVKLEDLTEETANFFIKAPDNNILEFILSKKNVLVEGDAEFILSETFFKNVINDNLASHDVHIISVDGTSFKRYLELSKLLSIKTAVIRDNDQDYQLNCIDNYSDYTDDLIKVFSDPDPTRFTFEKCVYEDNKAFCDDTFSEGRKSLTVLEYMLKNKAEVAFQLLSKYGAGINVPKYISDAFLWIKD